MIKTLTNVLKQDKEKFAVPKYKFFFARQSHALSKKDALESSF